MEKPTIKALIPAEMKKQPSCKKATKMMSKLSAIVRKFNLIIVGKFIKETIAPVENRSSICIL